MANFNNSSGTGLALTFYSAFKHIYDFVYCLLSYSKETTKALTFPLLTSETQEILHKSILKDWPQGSADSSNWS